MQNPRRLSNARTPRITSRELERELARLRSLQSTEAIDIDSESVRVFRAPGRVNLIGDHTDYNGGLVLPVAIDLSVYLACVRSEAVYLSSSSEPGIVALDSLTAEPLMTHPLPAWGNYPKGVLAELAEMGRPPVGFAGVIASEIPPGRGLSSSAALEIVVATAALAVADFFLPPWDVAEACRRAEERYAGVECGVMDQAISLMGKAGSALLIDTTRRIGEYVPLPEIIEIVAVDSGIRRDLAASEYNARRAECASALEILRGRVGFEDLSTLSDIDIEVLEVASKHLPERLAKRVRHVVSENLRVKKVTQILRELCEQSSSSTNHNHTEEAKFDIANTHRLLDKLGAILEESHQSLVFDYEAGHPLTDFVVKEAARLSGFIGARQTGAGWGGSVVVFAERRSGADLGKEIVERLTHHLGESSHRELASVRPTFHVCIPSDGAKEV